MSILDDYKGKGGRKPEPKENRRVVAKPLSEVVKKPWTGEGVKRGSNGRDWAKGTAPGPGRPAGIVAYAKARTNGLQDLLDRLIDAAMTGYYEMHDPDGTTSYAMLEPREITNAMAEIFNRCGLPKQAEKHVDVQKTITVGIEERRQKLRELSPEERMLYQKLVRAGLTAELESGTPSANVVDGEVTG